MEELRFVDDIIIKHCLSGVILRSSAARGRIRSIKTPKLPSNVNLVTAKDIPGINSLAGLGDAEIPVFAEDMISHYGQAAAMLLGPDPARLRELAEECAVLVEESTEEPAGEKPLERNYDSGGIETAFKQAVSVVEGTYSASFRNPWPGNPPGAIAEPGPGGRMIIHAPTRWPCHLKHSAAGVLGIKTGLVELYITRLEIQMDGKLWIPSLLASQAALGAAIRNKAVKLVYSPAENFLFSPKTIETQIHIQSALGKDGRVLGTKVNVSARSGAFGIFTEEIMDRIGLGALGAYNHGAVKLHTELSFVPLPPEEPAAGFGFAQGFFAAEQHASRIAGFLEEDPAEWRKNLSIRRGGKLPIGIEIREETSPEGLMDTAASMADYRRKWAANELLRKNRRVNASLWNFHEPLRGIGISLAYQGNSFINRTVAKEGVELTLEKDGSLKIRTSFPCGNLFDSWKALAAEILGVEELQIISHDTEKPVPESGPACLSRGIAVITQLIEKGCNAIRKQRFRTPLPITVYRYYHPAKARAWDRHPCDENALSPLSWGSAVVEAEIDPVEYIPRIRGIWIALEGGSILAESRARKAICSKIFESLAQEKNQDIPQPGIEFLWSQGGSKGIGELPLYTVPAAYTQALSQALDYPFENYPVSPEDIWTAVQRLSGGEAGT